MLPVGEDGMYVPSIAYEKDIVGFFANYLRCAPDFEVEPPYYVFLSFVGATGCGFYVGPMLAARDIRLQEEVVCVPEVLIRDPGDEPAQVLRPVFDMVWNTIWVSAIDELRPGWKVE